MTNNNEFIKKIQSITFGFGAKPIPAHKAKPFKIHCDDCGETHTIKPIAHIEVPTPVAAALMAAARRCGPPCRKPADEVAFSA